MKLSMQFRGLETSTMLALKSALKPYNAKLSARNGVLYLNATVNPQEYTQIMCLVSCFDPREIELRRASD